jgi:hypothetical protein
MRAAARCRARGRVGGVVVSQTGLQSGADPQIRRNGGDRRAARARQAPARFRVGVGRRQPRHRADARTVRQGVVAERRKAGRRACRTQYPMRFSKRTSEPPHLVRVLIN